MATLSPKKRKISQITGIVFESPSGLKRQKLCNTAITNTKQEFTLSKLKYCPKSCELSVKDPFFMYATSSNHNQYYRWVLSCKFIIASNYRLSSYDVLGMNRMKIPQNMFFFIDVDQNICALIETNTREHQISKSKHKNTSMDMLDHCRLQIETAVIESYSFNKSKTQHNSLQNALNHKKLIENHNTKLELQKLQKTQNKENNKNKNNKVDSENEDNDDLWSDVKKHKNVSKKHMRLRLNCDANDSERVMMHVVRIPNHYYSRNLHGSFYEMCCKMTVCIFKQSQISNPLFQLFFKTLANFDCFQMSVPMTPLSGNLYELFCQFALGTYTLRIEDANGEKNEVIDTHYENALSTNEFLAFLGCFDCWNIIKLNKKRRKVMHECWMKCTGTDVNIMKIVNGYCDFDEMTSERIVEYVNKFDKRHRNYKRYNKELREQIANLRKIIVH